MFREDETAAAPAFVDWVATREQGLWRFGHLVSGDRAATESALEHALDALHQEWDDLVDVVDLDVLVRQEIIRALASTHRGSSRQALRAPQETVQSRADRARNAVWDAYAQLDLEQRAALVLHHAEHRDAIDIAEVLACDPEVAEQHLAIGLELARLPVEHPEGDMRDDQPRDVESLLGEAFRAHAAGAPTSQAIGERVLAVSRRRRRRNGAVGTFAALVVLVPLAWLASPGETDMEPDVASPGVPLSEVPDMRWESYGGIEVQVPQSWGYGDLTQWCAPDDVPGQVDGPSVDRPGGGRTVHCSAGQSSGHHRTERVTYTAGLILRPAGEGPRLGRADVAHGAELFRRTVGNVDLTVVDVTAELARQILFSAEEVRRLDRNGCPIHEEIPPIGHHDGGGRHGLTGMASAVSASICHYETEPWGRPTLVFSERIADADAANHLLQRLEAAQPTDATAPAVHTAGCRETEAAMISFHGLGSADVWVHYAGCRPHGTDDGDQPRELTSDILEPVLDEPWRGQVADGVPWCGGR